MNKLNVSAPVIALGFAFGAGKDTTEIKVDAGYAVAKEKCNTFAGSAKGQCLDQAKARFGK